MARRDKAAALLREIKRRKDSPAEIAAREAHRRQEQAWRDRLCQDQVARLVPVIVAQLPVDADGDVVLGFSDDDGSPRWGDPQTLALDIARAVVKELLHAR